MGVRYVNASRLSRNELASSVASAGSDTIVFLLDANNDRNGNVYTLEDSIAWVTSASSVPVYRASFGGVGGGIAGSTYLDPEQDGGRPPRWPSRCSTARALRRFRWSWTGPWGTSSTGRC